VGTLAADPMPSSETPRRRDAGGLETKLLLARYARGRAQADRERLAERFEPLARSMAMRFAHTSEPLDDLRQVARLSLMTHHYLSRLPHRNRAVLLLRFHEDLKQREIGELLGISQMHVSRLIRQSLEMLRGIAAEEDARPRAVPG
jgi:DNA-directed RNA polymerase specialized sigma subunit